MGSNAWDSFEDTGRGLATLWFGILGPPVFWAARIAASYVLVPYACWWDWVVMLHLVTAVSLLGCAVAGLSAWQQWRKAGGNADVELGGPATRRRFMALVGILSSGLFFLVIVAEGLANVFIDPCLTAGAPLASATCSLQDPPRLHVRMAKMSAWLKRHSSWLLIHRCFVLAFASPIYLSLLVGCRDPAPRRTATGDPETGRSLIRQYGCHSCHLVPGVRGANGLVGPPLIHWRERVYIAGYLPNTPENLIRWIMSPQEIHEHTAMPNMGVSRGDAEHIAAYLFTLK